MFEVKNTKLSGFTLIEILIVMGITIILGGVGANSYYNYQSVQALEGASSEFTGALRDARQRAISQDESSAWGIYINAVADGNDYYELFYGNSRAAGTVASRTTLPSGVKFAVPAQGQTLEINFAKSTGLPNSEYTVTVASVKNSSVAETTTLNTTTGTVSTVSGVASAPTISSIIPSSGVNDDVVSITNLAGTGFQQGASVKLTKTGQSDVVCSDVSFVSLIKLTCTCDITGAIIGNWNVVVTNADSQSATLSNGFEITAYVPGAPTIGLPTGGDGQVSVAFSAPASDGGSTITGYTVTSSPGSLTGTGASSPITVSGLTNGTAYTFTVTATNAVGTGPASAASNSVTPPCGTTVSYGGQSYATVSIGAQCWFAQHLNIGTKITSCTNGYVGTCATGGDTVQNQGTSCVSIQKYCYNDNESFCTSEGGLYQWDQAMCGSTSSGAQGICPTGWHIPTHSEFTTMERTVCLSLGKSQETCESDFPDGTYTGDYGTTEGTALRVSGSSGFNWVIAGFRASNDPIAGSFGNEGFTYLWTSSQADSTYSWFRQLYPSNTHVGQSMQLKPYGFSVRCVQN